MYTPEEFEYFNEAIAQAQDIGTRLIYVKRVDISSTQVDDTYDEAIQKQYVKIDGDLPQFHARVMLNPDPEILEKFGLVENTKAIVTITRQSQKELNFYVRSDDVIVFDNADYQISKIFTDCRIPMIDYSSGYMLLNMALTTA